jgi:hypothetical protein
MSLEMEKNAVLFTWDEKLSSFGEMHAERRKKDGIQ